MKGAYQQRDLIRNKLYHALQMKNRVSVWELSENNKQLPEIAEVMKEAQMVECNPSGRLWTPGDGTYDWLVKQRERITHDAR